MTEKGKIREIRDNIVIVAPDRSDSCFGCMKLECKANGGILRAENPKGLALEPGQTVELKTPDTSFLGQSIAALLPPVIGFIIGFFLTRIFFPETGEGAAAFTGVILLFATAFLVYRLRKKFPAKEYLRYVERILDNKN